MWAHNPLPLWIGDELGEDIDCGTQWAMFGLDQIRLSQKAVVEILLALKTQNTLTQVVYSGEDVAVTFCNDFPNIRVPFYWQLGRTSSGYSALENEFSVLDNQLQALPWKRLILHFLAVISYI